MAREAVIRVRTEGERGLQRALQGIVRAAHRASSEQRRDAQTTTRAVEREEERRARSHSRTVRQELDDTRRAERQKRREAQETARAEETVLRRLRTQRRAARSEEGGGGPSFGSRLRAAGSQAAAGAVAVGRRAFARVEGYQAALGVPSRDEQVRMFIEAQQNLIRTTSQAGVTTEERNRAMAEVGRVATATNTDPTDLLNTLSMAQERFSNLPVDQLEAFARAAQASGSNVGDWAAAAGEFNRQLGVSQDEMSDLVGAIYQAGRAGSINPGDFASTFSGSMSAFRRFRGEGAMGASGAGEFIALSQSLGAGGLTPSETNTALGAFMRIGRSGRVRNAIERRIGRDTFDEQGRLAISSSDLLQRMHDDGSFATPRGLERMGIVDDQAQLAISMLMGRFEATGGNEVASLMGVSSAEGNRSIDDTVSALMHSTSGRAQAVGIESQVNFLQNGEQLVQIMTQLEGPLSDFQSRMPVTSEALSFLGETARDVGVTFAAMR
ncbi:MAG: phage tail tape measure protein, partial [Myxococcales bacterium]|nr:phage tail tape measure protein [Myxococcales bacterium]